MAASPAAPSTVSAIVKILQDRSATKLVNFTLGSIKVTPALLADVGKAIAAGKITVAVDPAISHDAIYDAGSNQLKLKANNPSPGLMDRALMIHEATHAASDIRKIGLTPNINDEAVGYIAQALYLYGSHLKKTRRLTSPNLAADSLFAAAHAAALAIVGKKNAAAIAQEVSKVRAALKLVPQYKKTIGMSAIYSGV